MCQVDGNTTIEHYFLKDNKLQISSFYRFFFLRELQVIVVFKNWCIRTSEGALNDYYMNKNRRVMKKTAESPIFSLTFPCCLL